MCKVVKTRNHFYEKKIKLCLRLLLPKPTEERGEIRNYGRIEMFGRVGFDLCQYICGVFLECLRTSGFGVMCTVVCPLSHIFVK